MSDIYTLKQHIAHLLEIIQFESIHNENINYIKDTIYNLIETNVEWKAAIDTIKDSIIIIDYEKKVLKANKAAKKQFNINTDDKIELALSEILYKDQCDPNCTCKKINTLIDCDTESTFEANDLSIPGIFEITVHPFIFNNQNYRVIHIKNISELRTAQRKYQEEHNFLNTILNNSAAGILVGSPITRKFIFANDVVCKMLGYSKDELVQMSVDDIHPEESMEFVKSEIQALLKKEKALSPNIPCITKDGKHIYADFDTSLVKIKNKDYIIGVVSEKTEKKFFEDKLKEHQWKLQSIVDCSQNGILIVKDDIVTFSNRTAALFLGKNIEDIEGKSFVYFCLNDIFEKDYFYEQFILSDTLKKSEKEVLLRRPDGTKSWISFNGLEIFVDGDIAILINMMDITYIKETEKQLLQSEKLSTIGQLAAGIAHEINNPLAYVSSNQRMLNNYIHSLRKVLNIVISLKTEQETLDQYTINNKINSIIERMEEIDIDYIMEDLNILLYETLDGIERIGKIVKDIKSFSRVDTEEMEKCNVNTLMDSAINITWNQIKYVAEIERNYKTQLPEIHCYPQQLSQVFMNIIINAVQAIEKKIKKNSDPTFQKGTIKITTNESIINKKMFLKIQIHDDGIGIPNEVKSRIFDPFFTTKEKQEGTGLGMSISLDIINKHSGTISFKSNPTDGTEFMILLPVE